MGKSGPETAVGDVDQDQDGCLHEGFDENIDDDDYVPDEDVEKDDHDSFEVATGDDDN